MARSVPDAMTGSIGLSGDKRGGGRSNPVLRARSLRDQGLIAYECPECVYVTSVLLQPLPRSGRD
jgi:hypothetical protein